MKTIALLLTTLLLALPLAGRVTKTTKRVRKPQTALTADDSIRAFACDTIVPTRDQIEVRGYDKARASRQETMFLHNATDRHIQAVALTLDYSDMQGRQLHSRHCRQNIDIPPGETRQMTIRTWDRQNAFYYYRNASGPSRTAATPYQVTCRVDTLILAK